jgi:hypothetical protein
MRTTPSNPNPFVEEALDIINGILEVDGTPTLAEVMSRLAEVEPLLSPYNVECVARTALFMPRRAPGQSSDPLALPAQAPSAGEGGEVLRLTAHLRSET